MTNLHHPYDKAARYAAKHSGKHLVPFLFPGLAKDTRYNRWLDTRSQPDPAVEDRTCDIVAELFDPQKPDRLQAAILEFQSQLQGDELDRGFEYVARIYLELRRQEDAKLTYDVFVNFVALTGNPQTRRLSMSLRGTRAQTHHQPESFAMSQVDFPAFLEGIAAKPSRHPLLYWGPLMQGADDPDTIQEWLRLAKRHFPARRQANLRTVAQTFSELPLRQRVWVESLKEWNVGESSLLKEWTAAAEVQAEAKGVVRSRQEVILRTLNQRFPRQIDSKLRDKIRTESQLAILDHWIDRAYYAQTMADFRETLGL